MPKGGAAASLRQGLTQVEAGYETVAAARRSEEGGTRPAELPSSRPGHRSPWNYQGDAFIVVNPTHDNRGEACSSSPPSCVKTPKVQPTIVSPTSRRAELASEVPRRRPRSMPRVHVQALLVLVGTQLGATREPIGHGVRGTRSQPCLLMDGAPSTGKIPLKKPPETSSIPGTLRYHIWWREGERHENRTSTYLMQVQRL